MKNRKILIIIFLIFLIGNLIGNFYSIGNLFFLENKKISLENNNINENILNINYNTDFDFDDYFSKTFDKISVEYIYEGSSYFGGKIFSLNTDRLDLNLYNTDGRFFENIGNFKGNSLYITLKNCDLESILTKLKSWNGEYLFLVKSKSNYDENNNTYFTKSEIEAISKLNIKSIEFMPSQNIPQEYKNILLENKNVNWQPDIIN